MTCRIVIFLLFFTLGFPTRSHANPAFEHGPRPPSAIFDPTRLLSTEVAEQIAIPLASYRAKDSIDIVVVILPDIGTAPPEHVARQFSDAWCDPLINCLVLHVPGRADGPWIVPGGRMIRDLLNPEIVDAQVAQARRRASREATEAGKVRAATTEAADLLRIWMGMSRIRTDEIRQQQLKFREMMEKRERLRKLALPAALAATVLLVALAYGAFVARRRFRSRWFPKTDIQCRLGAPHAGGNDACIDLGPTLHPHPSPRHP